jgi:hypothetical protein
MEYARLCATKNLLQEPDPVKAKAISPKILSQLWVVSSVPVTNILFPFK